VPQGIFVSGALFFKPKVNLRLLAAAVLQCSTDVYLPQTRQHVKTVAMLRAVESFTRSADLSELLPPARNDQTADRFDKPTP
jgi:hypothetical protein